MAWKARSTHRCLAPDCPAEITTKWLMCTVHWSRVPRPLQSRIVEAWKYGLANRCHPTSEYIDAVGAAQALLREKTARAQAASTLLAGAA